MLRPETPQQDKPWQEAEALWAEQRFERQTHCRAGRNVWLNKRIHELSS
ncbi:MAG: hypothetical protein LBS77_01885 [Desulfovibrio sp.]|jgi:type IV secretory pathway TrbF-like protein|nr:hypothetical protein [Desulfovibrio sp.]